MEQTSIGDYLNLSVPDQSVILRLILAGVILIVGWILALLLSAVARRILVGLRVNERLAPRTADAEAGERPRLDLERLITQLVFYVSMLFVLVAFFEQLGIAAVTVPIQELLTRLMTDYLPGIVAAGAILVVAWVVANLVRFVVLQAARLSDIDQRLARTAELDDAQPLSAASSMATAAYWLVFLLFLPTIFGRLNMPELAEPIQDMTAKVLLFLPDALAAAIILLVGWFVARIVRQVITNLLAAAGTDELGQRVGFLGDQPLSALLGTIVYAVVVILVAIQALQALHVEAISAPAMAMLSTAFQAIPNVIAAILLLIVAYYAGRLVSGLAASVLEGVGFDQLPARLGVQGVPAEGQRTPSELAGLVVLLAIMLFAVAEAASLLGFETLASAVDQAIGFGGQAVVALAILAIGVYLANLAHSAILGTAGEHAGRLAWIARAAILVLVAAMALEHIDVGQDIVREAFRALVYAIAAAAALAFGLGGRDRASREIDRMIDAARGRTAAE